MFSSYFNDTVQIRDVEIEEGKSTFFIETNEILTDLALKEITKLTEFS